LSGGFKRRLLGSRGDCRELIKRKEDRNFSNLMAIALNYTSMCI